MPPPATPITSVPIPADANKAMPPPSADPNLKRNKRQSLSLPKGAQEQVAHSVEHPVGGAAPAPARPPTSGPAPPAAGIQGLSQVGSPPTALRELPALRDAPPNKREELFKLKLQLCGVIFSFDDPTSDKRGKVFLTLFRPFAAFTDEVLISVSVIFRRT